MPIPDTSANHKRRAAAVAIILVTLIISVSYFLIGTDSIFGGGSSTMGVVISESEIRKLVFKNDLVMPPVELRRFVLGFLETRETLNHINTSSGQMYRDFLTRNLSWPSKPSVTVLSASFNDRPYSVMSKRVLTDYANRHGYALKYFDKPKDNRYPMMWQKILFILDTLLTNFSDVVMWLDDDAIITNVSVKVENFLRILDPLQLDFVATTDELRDPKTFFNAGVLIFRNNHLILDYFKRVLEGYDKIPFYRTHYNFEQDVMNLLFYETPALRNRSLILPHCFQQSFDPVWKPGHFIMHTPGVSKAQKLRNVEFFVKVHQENWGSFPRTRGPGSWTCRG